MKLKNKKTGEIGELASMLRTLVYVDNLPKYKYTTLAELNEEWEDYEEPKRRWVITESGLVVCQESRTLTCLGEDEMAIGNYFETEEEAEKAVEKLKAWERLKNNGFKFTGWERDKEYCGDFRLTAIDMTTCSDKDLDLLFGGEDE